MEGKVRNNEKAVLVGLQTLFSSQELFLKQNN
jgi:hypothetical protein